MQKEKKSKEDREFIILKDRRDKDRLKALRSEVALEEWKKKHWSRWGKEHEERLEQSKEYIRFLLETGGDGLVYDKAFKYFRG